MNRKLHRLWATKNRNDEWWSSFVTSPLAIATNLLVVDWKWLTPNLITLFSFITALVATVLIVVGGQLAFCTAAVLIHASHVLDCMDGQMARYRGVSSPWGSFLDKMTDQVQVFLWFGAVSYAAYIQSGSVLPVFLAFTGTAFYSLRGYVKYATITIAMSEDKDYLERAAREVSLIESKNAGKGGLGKGLAANLRWFVGEQRKILSFDEGVFIFMLSAALVFDALTPMLWIFAISQTLYGTARSLQRGGQLERDQLDQILTTTEK